MADIEEIQEKVAEGSDEEEGLGSNEPQIDLSFLDQKQEQPKGPPLSETIAQRAGVAGARVGGAARGLLSEVGAKIEEPAPPGDDLNDLFEGPDMEKDNDVYIKDLVTVEEEDVMGDGDPEMRDLLEVTDEDITGEPDEPVQTRSTTHPKRSVPSRSSPQDILKGVS